MARRSSKKQPPKRLILLTVVIACLLLIGAAFVYKVNTANDTKNITPSGIDLNPATPEEKRDSDRHKEEIVQSQKQASTSPESSKKSVTPVIVNASLQGDNVEVRSYVSGIFEDGGVCTATFTKGGKSLSRESSGFKDATVTNCAPILVNKSDFPETGEWSVVVGYSSGAASGSSPSVVVEVK